MSFYVKSPKGERNDCPGTDDGIPFVTDQYRWYVSVTPANADLPSGTCDAIAVSADANVTIVSADDNTATAVTFALKAGVIYPLGASRITTVSTGTAIALYHRKPGMLV